MEKTKIDKLRELREDLEREMESFAATLYESGYEKDDTKIVLDRVLHSVLSAVYD